MEQKTPIMMTQEFWRNSQLSVARFYGRCKAFGYTYMVLNKDGLDLFACSVLAERLGKEYAIDPGEPADLVRFDFVKFYFKLKRDKFMEVLKENIHTSDKELKDIYMALCKEKKEKKNELNLFEEK